MNSKCFKSILPLILAAFIIIGNIHAAAASDIISIPFPELPPGVTTHNYTADVLSGNGLVVAGKHEYLKGPEFHDNGEYTGLFLWTKEDGFNFFFENTRLPRLYHKTTELSHEGSAVGYANDWLTMGGYWYYSFRYTIHDGHQGLYHENFMYQKASDISSDGSVVVGWSGLPIHGWDGIYLWDESDGPSEIAPPIANCFQESEGPVISGDGETIIVNCDEYPNEYFNRWTESGGYERLGEGTAVDISTDGNVIVGTTPEGEAFRYTDTGGIELIGSFLPRKTNVDGSLVIGENFIWDDLNGLQVIDDYLTMKGIDLETDDWTIYTVNDISNDGNVIIGTGSNNLSNNIVDDADSTMTSLSGDWIYSSSVPGGYNAHYRYAEPGDGSKWFKWTLNVNSNESCELFAQWPAGDDHANDATYEIYHEYGAIATVTVDQTVNGGQFNSLGTFTSGTGTFVIILRDRPSGVVVADAVKSAFTDKPWVATITAPPRPKTITIDIKPRSQKNKINLKRRGKVKVAVITTDDFDAKEVDPKTCIFAGAKPVRWKLKDVDKDNDSDLLLIYKKNELLLTKHSTTASLDGETYDGVTIQGTDSVKVVQ